MPSEKPRIATYTTEETLKKFKYISDTNHRSMSNMLQTIISKCIDDFEKENGTIETHQ